MSATILCTLERRTVLTPRGSGERGSDLVGWQYFGGREAGAWGEVVEGAGSREGVGREERVVVV